MKKILILLLTLAALAGIYWFLTNNKLYELSPRGLNNPNSKGLIRGATDAFNNAKDAVTNFVFRKGAEAQKTSQQKLDAAAKKGEALVADQKKSLTDRFRNAVDDALITVVDAGRGLLGIATGTGSPVAGSRPGQSVGGGNGDAILSPLGTVVHRGQPVTFAVSKDLFKKNNIGESSYSASWGDGDQEYKKIYADVKNEFITHTFQKAGEYRSLFTFTVGKNTIQYEITVIVEE